MKKTIWQPFILGTVFGLLAGTASVTGLLFLVPGLGGDNAIGFWMTLLLISASLGGPLAGVTASILLMTISAFFGSPDMKAIVNDPIIFWTNLPVIGMLTAMVGFAYRFIFERVKMPIRLIFWAGIVIVVYVINSPANLIPQFYLYGESDVLPAILSGYRVYLPQAIFDIIITSLIFIALPIRYSRPLWYESQNVHPPAKEKVQAQEVYK